MGTFGFGALEVMAQTLVPPPVARRPQSEQTCEIVPRKIVGDVKPGSLVLYENVLVRLQRWIVLQKTGGNLAQARVRTRIWDRRTASGAERNPIGRRVAKDRRFVGRQQFLTRNKTKVRRFYVHASGERGARGFSASPTMTELKWARRFLDFEAHCATQAASSDHVTSTFFFYATAPKSARRWCSMKMISDGQSNALSPVISRPRISV